ncbi:class I SAM-dependent methyltransferase [Ruicaihuangia caeni]|uniref:Methyltransferase domain-containing protein n=1 Tax=Ruicaihuangia caeni TaxID=3042517 RepID=A0AAW6T6M7_9MICO|nr:class I SAM-dependent methyltransferase [Klugiella sp. YN-L-19]MDI2097808.1 methyltransferase domain-containing protein [Klugiella sp. YN-L-19]
MASRHERYTHGHHESVLRSHTWRNVENSADHLVPHLAPGMSLLDVGCGPGTITADLAARVSPGRVVGIDASSEVLDQAESYARGLGGSNLEFAVGDVYELEFDDGTFDVVHTHQVLHHLVDPVAALREMRRVCKPGGVVSAREADYHGMFWFPQLEGLDEWMTLYQRVHRANGGDPDAGRRVKSWALQAGFTEVEASGAMWCYTSDDEREWWGGLWADRAVKSGFATNAIEQGLATQQDLERISQAWRDWAAAPDGWLSLPHGWVLCRG